jgi:hypothetical protein
LYVRSPAAFFDDSIFSPPLLPRMLTKPRTVCGCQSVAFHNFGQRHAFRALHHVAVSGAGLLMFPLSIAFSLIQFLLDRVAVVTWITQLRRNIKLNLRDYGLRRRRGWNKPIWRAQPLF